MSTRATILIKDSKNKKYIYHHCDGYPEGVGTDLRLKLEHIIHMNKDKDYKITVDEVVHELLSDTYETYEMTTNIHGDSEYVYLIDVEKPELKCYWWEWDGKEELMNSEHEVDIQNNKIYNWPEICRLMDDITRTAKEVEMALDYSIKLGEDISKYKAEDYGEVTDKNMENNMKEIEQDALQWNDMVNDLKEKLRKGKVKFTYRKKNGDIREAVGTLHGAYIPEDQVPSQIGYPNPDIVRYYDINSQGWRSFIKCNLEAVGDLIVD